MPEKLCNLKDILEDTSKGFGDGSTSSVFAVRKAGKVYVYQNRCPHVGAPLNWMPNRFLDKTKEHIICTSHGALFDIKNGHCLVGPCPGEQLTAVPFKTINGELWLS